MPDPMTLEEYFQTEAGQQLQVDMAGMSDAENATMMNQLQSAADAGDLHEGFNTDGMFLDSQVAEGARQGAEQLQSEQAQAVADGDWDKAHDLAQQAEYSMQEVRDHGGDVAQAELDQNSDDLSNTEWAEYHQEIADDNAVTAASYAEAGDADHAAQYGETAANEAGAAADYGVQADQGGTYADHTVDTSSTFDATASSSSYDASSASVDTSAAVDTSATTTE